MNKQEERWHDTFELVLNEAILRIKKKHLLKVMKIFEILDSIQIPDLKLDKSQAR